ncbi:hypothetical protein C8J56DRAFT_906261 [Mycena floridula]|nr:hypothetical protein C8J56DRAFT_906261 [Mycena floridula]
MWKRVILSVYIERLDSRNIGHVEMMDREGNKDNPTKRQDPTTRLGEDLTTRLNVPSWAQITVYNSSTADFPIDSLAEAEVRRDLKLWIEVTEVRRAKLLGRLREEAAFEQAGTSESKGGAA